MASKSVTTTDTAEVSTLGYQLRELIEAIPVVEADSAVQRIVEAIISARTVEELSDPWSGTNALGEYDGRVVRIHSIRRAPSAFAAGTGIFLVLDVEDSSGEHHVVTTGAISVVVQLLKAYELDAFPLTCIPRVAARASARGYYPQHLDTRVNPEES